MADLVLHYHPLSSCCHKVLIALDELAIEVDKRLLDFADAEARSAFLALWPSGKIPLLIDRGRPIAETSIIIEYLQLHHAGNAHRLIPAAAEAALEVRLWDRLADLYVMTPMQAFTAHRMRAEHERRATELTQPSATLAMAYTLFDRQLQGGPWLAGEQFSLADCAAAPALFYAQAYQAFPESLARLHAYFERLLTRPSVARCIDQARPYLQYFPGRDGLSPRF